MVNVPQFESSVGRRNDWCLLIAFAWKNEDSVLCELRTDPKTAITELAKGKSGKYEKLLESPDIEKKVASNIVEAAKRIQTQADDFPLAHDYAGYLPIPSSPLGEDLEEEDIQEGLTFLENLIESGGLTGIFQCDRHPEEWASIFKYAWSNSENLKNIRQNPLKYLPEEDKDKLLNPDYSDYGIFPLPGQPERLSCLKIDDLSKFLSDQETVDHIGGIFLMGC